MQLRSKLMQCSDQWVYVDHYCLVFFGFFDFPAFDRAIATACFCGFPASISIRMFADITFFDLPFFSGMIFLQSY